MQVWTNTEFRGRYPVGTAAVVIADTASQAAAMLNDELERLGLERSAMPDQFKRVPAARPLAVVLHDGNY